MKKFLLFLAFGLAASDKLDRKYLPPPGAKFSGGVPGNLEVPFEFPKETYSTTRPPSSFNNRPETPEDKRIEIGINRGLEPGVPGVDFDSNVYTPSSKAPLDYYQKVPTTTTSYAFTQTTTHPPVEGFETTLGPIIPTGFPSTVGPTGLPNTTPFFDYPTPTPGFPVSQNIYRGQQIIPGYQPPNLIKQGVPSGVTQYPGSTAIPIVGSVFDPNRPSLGQDNLNQYQNTQRPGFPTQRPGFDFQTPGQNQEIPGQQASVIPQVVTPGSQYRNDLNRIQSTIAPGSIPVFPGTTPTSLPSHLDGKIESIVPGTDFQYPMTPVQKPGLVQPGATVRPVNQLNQIAPQNQYQVDKDGFVQPGNIQIRPGQQQFTGEQYPSQVDQFGRPVSAQNQSFANVSPTSPVSNYNQGLNVRPGSFPTTATDQFSPTPVYPGIGAQFPGLVSRPERPQAESDRNAVILNYDNVINPDGTYAYSYDTSNGIHADESGNATNGVRAKGGYSYIGDDGKVYSIVYTADENGFRPQGDHLPTSPPIPEAIQKVIEQVIKDKEAGISDDGTYDEAKYGHKKLQGGQRPYRPSKIDSGVQRNDNDYDQVDRKPQTGSRRPVSSEQGAIDDYETDDQERFTGDAADSDTKRRPGGSPSRPTSEHKGVSESDYDGTGISSDKKRPIGKLPSRRPTSRPNGSDASHDEDISESDYDSTKPNSDKKRPMGKIPSRRPSSRPDETDSSYSSEDISESDYDSTKPSSDQKRPIGKIPSRRPTSRPGESGSSYSGEDISESDYDVTKDSSDKKRPIGKIPSRRPTSKHDESDSYSDEGEPDYDGTKYSSDKNIPIDKIPSRRPTFRPNASGSSYSDEDSGDYIEEQDTKLPARRPGQSSSTKDNILGGGNRKQTGVKMPPRKIIGQYGKFDDTDRDDGIPEKMRGKLPFSGSNKYLPSVSDSRRPMPPMSNQYYETEEGSEEPEDFEQQSENIDKMKYVPGSKYETSKPTGSRRPIRPTGSTQSYDKYDANRERLPVSSTLAPQTDDGNIAVNVSDFNRRPGGVTKYTTVTPNIGQETTLAPQFDDRQIVQSFDKVTGRPIIYQRPGQIDQYVTRRPSDGQEGTYPQIEEENQYDNRVTPGKISTFDQNIGKPGSRLPGQINQFTSTTRPFGQQTTLIPQNDDRFDDGQIYIPGKSDQNKRPVFGQRISPTNKYTTKPITDDKGYQYLPPQKKFDEQDKTYLKGEVAKPFMTPDVTRDEEIDEISGDRVSSRPSVRPGQVVYDKVASTVRPSSQQQFYSKDKEPGYYGVKDSDVAKPGEDKYLTRVPGKYTTVDSTRRPFQQIQTTVRPQQHIQQTTGEYEGSQDFPQGTLRPVQKDRYFVDKDGRRHEIVSSTPIPSQSTRFDVTQPTQRPGQQVTDRYRGNNYVSTTQMPQTPGQFETSSQTPEYQTTYRPAGSADDILPGSQISTMRPGTQFTGRPGYTQVNIPKTTYRPNYSTERVSTRPAVDAFGRPIAGSIETTARPGFSNVPGTDYQNVPFSQELDQQFSGEHRPAVDAFGQPIPGAIGTTARPDFSNIPGGSSQNVPYSQELDQQFSGERRPTVDAFGRPIAGSIGTTARPGFSNIPGGVSQNVPISQELDQQFSGERRPAVDAFGRPIPGAIGTTARPGFSNIPGGISQNVPMSQEFDQRFSGERRPAVDAFGRPITGAIGTTARPGFSNIPGGDSQNEPISQELDQQFSGERRPAVDAFGRPIAGSTARPIFSNVPGGNRQNVPSIQDQVDQKFSGDVKSDGKPSVIKPEGSTERIIGEDFSGPKQQQRYDPERGYYY